MSIWSTIQEALKQPEFWKFSAKDLITAVIALAAFLTATTNVWVAYLRPRKLRCDVGEALRISYGSRPEHYLIFRLHVFALNLGARPGVITRMMIEIKSNQRAILLHWTEVTKTEDVADKGSARNVWTKFAGFSSPVLVPKYDARLIEAAFWANQSGELLPDQQYRFRLHIWVAGRKKQIVGNERTFSITQADDQVLQTTGTLNDKGVRTKSLHLASFDGKKFHNLRFRVPIPVTSSWRCNPLFRRKSRTSELKGQALESVRRNAAPRNYHHQILGSWFMRSFYDRRYDGSSTNLTTCVEDLRCFYLNSPIDARTLDFSGVPLFTQRFVKSCRAE